MAHVGDIAAWLYRSGVRHNTIVAVRRKTIDVRLADGKLKQVSKTQLLGIVKP